MGPLTVREMLNAAREDQKVLDERKRCIRIVRSVTIQHLGDYNWMADEIIRKISEGL
jgi:hypothetical protein